MAELVFIKVPVSDENGEEREDVRIQLNLITDYRPWRNSDSEKEQTAFFWMKHLKKPKTVADLSADEVDKLIKTVTL